MYQAGSFLSTIKEDGFVTTPSSLLRVILRHCDVLYVRIIPQVLRASNPEPLLCHRFSRHYYSCYEFIKEGLQRTKNHEQMPLFPFSANA